MEKKRKRLKFYSKFFKYLLICEAATFLVEVMAAFTAGAPFLTALREQMMQWGLRAHIGVLIGVLVGSYWCYRKDKGKKTAPPEEA